MGYSIEASGDSCYPNTTCLINKFNIKDDKKLSQIEAEITFAKAAVLESEETKPPFDFNFSNINPDLLMIATIKAANGVTDDLYNIFNNEIK